jgi:hypothetical protein
VRVWKSETGGLGFVEKQRCGGALLPLLIPMAGRWTDETLATMPAGGHGNLTELRIAGLGGLGDISKLSDDDLPALDRLR